MPGEPLAANPDPTDPDPTEAESNPETPPSPLRQQPKPPPPPPPAPASLRPWLGLDRQGLLEALGGTVIALIALFSSYDHITLADRSIPLQQQWGVWLIAASLALVVV